MSSVTRSLGHSVTRSLHPCFVALAVAAALAACRGTGGADPSEWEAPPLAVRSRPGEVDPFSPPLWAVRIPGERLLDDPFPEMTTLVRPLRAEEVAAVIEDVRASNPGSDRAERMAEPFGQFWLASFDRIERDRLELAGIDVHPVPVSWDESRFRSPEELAADIAARESASGAAESEIGVAVEAIVVAPDDVPTPSCSSTPATDNFCPYDTTTSSTGGFVCTRSLSRQLLDGEMAYPAVMIGSSWRDYYRWITVGTTAGRTFTGSPLNREVTGVRLGRAPDAAVPVVRQVVIVAGQHGNEWEGVEMARRLIFYFASQYAAGNAFVRQLLDEQALLIVPAANPDGYETTHTSSRGWRGNMQWCMSGATLGWIDTNRNFQFTWGIDDLGSDDTCGESAYRGAAAGEAAETGMFNSLLSTPGYRTAVVVNLHTRAGAILLPGGFSPGTPVPGSACLDGTNCTNPDLGIFYRLAGTERSPILRHPNATNVPYVVDQSVRALYSTNGTLDQNAEYGALPSGIPNVLSLTVELAAPCGNTTTEHRTAAATLAQQESDLRQLVIRHLLYLPALVNGTTNAFELPILQRRNVGASPAAEPLTLRVAVRNNVSGTTITNIAPVAGAHFSDTTTRQGAYYRLHGWRPTSGWTWPSRSFVCATGQTCGIVTLDAPTNAATVNLCDPSRFSAGSAWSWSSTNCNWTLTRAELIDASTLLASTPRDLTHMSQSRLVLSHWRGTGQASPGFVAFDIEVSSNGFVGCSWNNYGNCRIVRRIGQDDENRSTPPAGYHTVVADVSDFDGQSNVRMRVRLWGNFSLFCGDGSCDAGESVGSCPADCTAPVPRLRVYDPAFVGWYQ